MKKKNIKFGKLLFVDWINGLAMVEVDDDISYHTLGLNEPEGDA
jgi:hypothetical protein